MNQTFCDDRRRYGGGRGMLTCYELRFLWLLRRLQGGGGVLSKLAHRRMVLKYGLEIPAAASIGGGLYLGHARNITVNPAAVIGRNCNLRKGVTIGQENRGRRKGAPRIGDRVWIGANSTVVGSVGIGSDVLIAPNSYVNCDVPSHSIVLGSPCKIIPREDATAGYVNNIA